MKIRLIIIIILFSSLNSFSKTYELDAGRESAIIIPAALIYGFSLFQDSQMPVADKELINSLDSEKINKLDRAAVHKWSVKSADVSDYLLGFSVLAPFLLNLDNKVNNEFIQFATIYSEVLLLNNAITNIVKVNTKRIRPYAYNEEIPIIAKTNKDIKKSFFSGHTSNAFAMFVMSAKMYSDYFPDSKFRESVWLAALSIASATGIARYYAGKHFPTDIIAGAVVGSAIGYLIPEIHKNKSGVISVNNNYMINFSYSF
jgi:membrane-associated phospholipid phosphatase